MRFQTCIRKSLGLKAHYVREIREEDGRLVAEIGRIGRRKLCCSGCGQEAQAVESSRGVPREWQSLPVVGQVLVLRYAPYRVRCRHCGLRTEQVPWAGKWQRVTKALARAIAVLARELSWKAVARHFGVNWKTVASVVGRAVAEGLQKRPWKPLHVIGIDEVSRAKGQKYLTLVYDLERGKLVWIGEGRDLGTMEAFLKWLGRRGRSIRTVCCDMWRAFVTLVREHLPQADLIFDRFHVVQHLSRAVDEVRRQTWRQLSGEEKRDFKRTRWLWLKNPWNLKDPEKRRLSQLCRKNAPIVRAYYLKEAFRSYWSYVREGWAHPYLEDWLRKAERSRLPPFVQFAKMIRKHKDGILAWTKLHVSNAALEGMNNKVKAVSHRGFGYRTIKTYITAIWHTCGNLPLD